MKISVIVPCFNVGKLLQPLFQSLEQQDCEDFEVLFVNDGSTDDTSTVLRQFCNSVPTKYRLIEKGNGGVSSARNAGLDNAKGELLFFVDGDDYIYPNTLRTLSTLMTEGVDIAVGAFRNSDGTIHIFDHTADPDRWLLRNMMKGGLTLWNKMFRRNIIEANHIRFDTTTTKSEDHLFTAEYMMYSQGAIATTDELIYCYVPNPMSISNISLTTHTFSPWIADSVGTAVRIYRMLEHHLSSATLRELRYDTYHKYRRVRHEAHVHNYKDRAFYDDIYGKTRSIMSPLEMAWFAVRRRMSIISNSFIKKIKNLF